MPLKQQRRRPAFLGQMYMPTLTGQGLKGSTRQHRVGPDLIHGRAIPGILLIPDVPLIMSPVIFIITAYAPRGWTCAKANFTGNSQIICMTCSAVSGLGGKELPCCASICLLCQAVSGVAPWVMSMSDFLQPQSTHQHRGPVNTVTQAMTKQALHDCKLEMMYQCVAPCSGVEAHTKQRTLRFQFCIFKHSSSLRI